MRSDHVIYTERTPWAPWVYVLYWAGFLAAAGPILAGWGVPSPFPQRFLLATGIVLLAALLAVFIEGMTVRVKQHELHAFLGRVPVFSKHVAYADIRSIESVRYHPMKEFGGWGLRGSGGKQAWTARGDRALVLHLLDGRDIYVGSDNPDRLAERVRMGSGGRFGTRE